MNLVLHYEHFFKWSLIIILLFKHSETTIIHYNEIVNHVLITFCVYVFMFVCVCLCMYINNVQMCMWKPEKFKHYSSDVIQYLCATEFFTAREISKSAWLSGLQLQIATFLCSSRNRISFSNMADIYRMAYLIQTHMLHIVN